MYNIREDKFGDNSSSAEFVDGTICIPLVLRQLLHSVMYKHL
jgi:hypothetical protein